MLVELLSRVSMLERALSAQRARAADLRAEIDASDASLSSEIERLRGEEAGAWEDFVPLLHSKRVRLQQLEKDAASKDLALSDKEGDYL